METIPKGQFIIEYVGEVITHEEFVKRTKYDEQSAKQYYTMELNNQLYIDGYHFGNISRYINHRYIYIARIHHLVVNPIAKFKNGQCVEESDWVCLPCVTFNAMKN